MVSQSTVFTNKSSVQNQHFPATTDNNTCSQAEIDNIPLGAIYSNLHLRNIIFFLKPMTDAGRVDLKWMPYSCGNDAYVTIVCN